MIVSFTGNACDGFRPHHMRVKSENPGPHRAMFESLFVQIAAILGLAAIGGGLAQLLRQPLIVAFIAVGVLLGPSALGMVTRSSEIELFAGLGIALLLFVVGLKLDLHIIRTVGPVALGKVRTSS